MQEIKLTRYSHGAGCGCKISTKQQDILCDAQTSGGILCAVVKSQVEAFLTLTQKAGLDLQSIGDTVTKREHLIEVL